MTDATPRARRRRRPQAGKGLRAELDDALQRQSARLGQPLRWDEHEARHIAAACHAADHVELLARRLDDEVAGENRASILVQLASEIRLQDRAVTEHLGRIQIDDVAPLKSPQHRAAAVSRWGANRPKKGA